MYRSTDLSIILGSINKYYLIYIHEAKPERVIDPVPCHNNMAQPKGGEGVAASLQPPKIFQNQN
jgi:hypothetical protein